MSIEEIEEAVSSELNNVGVEPCRRRLWIFAVIPIAKLVQKQTI